MIKKFVLSIAGGVIWGWMAMFVNSVSGAFMFEGSFPHNLVTFAVAGAVFGAVAGGLLCAVEARLPFKSLALKAVMVTTAVWVVLRLGGAMLSKMEPARYNIVTPQTVQGFFLAVILGIILGLLLKNRPLPIQES
ncbi:MAG: hypothetical protein HZB82_09435 [Deltaproteobacteria bacterium]|nr:hypothetical protein [Deltaproteobacteria bacterium]